MRKAQHIILHTLMLLADAFYTFVASLFGIIVFNMIMASASPVALAWTVFGAITALTGISFGIQGLKDWNKKHNPVLS